MHLRLGPVTILSGVSLAVDPGEVVGIAGPNGAGKTSLLEVLAGRYRPTSGSVTLAGADVTSVPVHRRARRGIGRLYQRPVVPTNLSVSQAMEAARRAYRPRPSAHRLEWARDLVGLGVDESRLCGALDTLDRRRLLLACVMLRQPSVLLLDEPASGLTGSEIDEIELLIRRLSMEHGIAVVVVEHRLELLAAVASRVMILHLGSTIAHGEPEAAFTQPEVRSVYFEHATPAPAGGEQ